MQHALPLPTLRLPDLSPLATRVLAALGLAVLAMSQPSVRAVLALMVWSLVQSLMLGLRAELARVEADRSAGRRTLAVTLGRARTRRLLHIVNVEALVFAGTAVATGVFSPALALLAGGVAALTARGLRAQG